MADGLDIGIAGAGIAGLASAALLARQGHTVTLFDQFGTAGPVGSGLMLQETGLAVLAALGLRRGLEAVGAPISRLHGLCADTQRPVLDVRYASLRPGLAGLGIGRGVLFNALYEAALSAGVRLEKATRIVSADRMDGFFADEAGRRHGRYDLLVDALGVRSALSASPRRELPYGALWATFPWPETGSFERGVLSQRYRAARQMAGVMPSGRAGIGAGESLTYFWSIRTDRYDDFIASPLDQWKDEARALWPATSVLLDQLSDHRQLTFARYRHRTHVPVIEERLVHVGDAWHAASPQLGQGANMALLDAWALSLALSGRRETGAALKRFRRLRALHVHLYQGLTAALTPVYQSDGWVMAWLRDHLAAPLLGLWPVPPLLALLVAGGVGAPLHRLGLRD